MNLDTNDDSRPFRYPPAFYCSVSITFGARWHGVHLAYVLNMANPNSETVPSILKIPRGTLGQLYLYICIYTEYGDWFRNSDTE